MTTATIPTSLPLTSSNQKGRIYELNQTSINLPERLLAKDALEVATLTEKSYANWTEDEHTDSFLLLQEIAKFWDQQQVANQYLIYGKQSLEKPSLFKWEVVPFKECSTLIGRIWQQLVVFLRITFGGYTLSSATRKDKINQMQQSLQPNFNPAYQPLTENNDPFCKQEIIKKQKIFKGKEINVLYPNAPISYGDEPLHFLFIPKKHKESLETLSLNEYLEVAELAKKILTHFSRDRTLQDAFFYHKKGVCAGQTIPHWHMHLVLTANKTQTLFGRLNVIKNTLFGSLKLTDQELNRAVSKYRSELNNLYAPST